MEKSSCAVSNDCSIFVVTFWGISQIGERDATLKGARMTPGNRHYTAIFIDTYLTPSEWGEGAKYFLFQ